MAHTKMKNLDTAKLLFSMLIFGTVGIFVRLVPFPSAFIALTRGFIGAIFLLCFIFISGKRLDLSAIRKNLPRLLISGTAIGINWILLFESYRYTTVAVATLCYYMAPVIVIFGAAIFYKERISPKRGICALVAIVGMTMVSGIMDGGGVGSPIGIILGLLAAVFYSSVTLISRGMKEISAYDITTVQLVVAATVVTPYSIIAEDVTFAGVLPYQYVVLILLGVLHTGFCYALYFGVVKALPSRKVAIFAYVDPIVAIILSALILKESMSVFAVIGAVMIILSMIASEISFEKLAGLKDNKQNTKPTE